MPNIPKLEKLTVDRCKVLHVVDKLVSSSGVASVIVNMVEHSSYIQDVAVYSDTDPIIVDRVEKRGGKVYQINDVRHNIGIPFKKDISKLLLKNKYTVVHGHLLNSAYIYMREAKRHCVPIRIIHSHSAKSANTLFKRIRNDMLKLGIPLWSNVYLACSKPAAFNAFGKRLAHIVNYGIDTEKFKFNADVRQFVRRELGIVNGEICIGSVARFSPEKNHKFMFKILESTPNAVGVFVGGGKLPDTAQIPESVKFVGVHSDISKLYQAFDVFILPSLFEGFPVSSIEAQCAGLPCLVSNTVTRAIDCSGNVIFLPIDNPIVWAEKIFELAKKQRTDGSVAIANAGMDVLTMVRKIEKLWSGGTNIDGI